MPRTLLLADDHQLFLEGLKVLLDRTDEWVVAGEAHNGLEVVDFLQGQLVDVVLMDIEMPNLNGIEATRRVKNLFPNVRIIALSMMGDYLTVRQMLRAGADGYLVKNVGMNEILKALNQVAGGDLYVSPHLMPALVGGVMERKPAHATSYVEPLTQREREIVTLIVEGLTNDQIATHLCLSKTTIDTHRKNVLSKLQVKNTAALVRLVLEKKLLE